MLCSMTGFGEAVYEDSALRVGFRIKSVNYRGIDVNLKLPFDFMYLEPEIREIVKHELHRGRLDVFTEIEIRDPDAAPPTPLNRARLGQLLKLSGEMSEGYGVTGELDVNTMVRLPDLTVSQRVGYRLPETFNAQILQTFREALIRLQESRRKEGEAIAAFIDQTMTLQEERVDELTGMVAQRRDDLKSALRKKVEMLMEDSEIDEVRLSQEVVYYSDRLDVTEEITRLQAHIQSTRDLLSSGKKPLGKELEFMLQEQTREVTTIGNKARHRDIAAVVVKLKTGYEKLREQILNVE